MKKIVIVASALVIGMSASIVSASAGEKAQNVDYRAAAGKRLEALVAKKVNCYTDAGLKQNVQFRINPKDKLTIQINDLFMAGADDRTLAEMAKCKAMTN
jgi:hypothetical protein